MLWNRFRNAAFKKRLFAKHQGKNFAEKAGVTLTSITRFFSEQSREAPNFKILMKVLRACDVDTQYKAVNWICRHFGFRPVKDFEFTKEELLKNGNEIWKQWGYCDVEDSKVTLAITDSLNDDNKIDLMEARKIHQKTQQASYKTQRFESWVGQKIKLLEQNQQNTQTHKSI